MKSRSPVALIGSVAMSLALVACGDDGGGTGGASAGGGGPGSGGGATTGTTTGSTSVASTSSGTGGAGTTTSTGQGGEGGAGGSGGAGPVTASSSGQGGSGGEGGFGGGPATTGQGGAGGGSGECVGQPFFSDPACDTCAQALCCVEIEACLADPASCFTDEGFIDPASPGGGALEGCLEGSCADECGGNLGMCDSGLTFQDDAIDACFDPACCVGLDACLANGQDMCIQCINDFLETGDPPGAACEDFVVCGETEGCFG